MANLYSDCCMWISDAPRCEHKPFADDELDIENPQTYCYCHYYHSTVSELTEDQCLHTGLLEKSLL